MLSDNGGEFISEELKDFLKAEGIEERHGLPYKPTTQGVVERCNQTVKK